MSSQVQMERMLYLLRRIDEGALMDKEECVRVRSSPREYLSIKGTRIVITKRIIS